jgi:adenosyl cobinamide kinase/adenosyl cobinamide phosphate guanylyltransferase/cobalamin synthase
VITLVLGGVRSGKSEVAERLAGPGPGTYLATGLVAPGDDDFADRVARHRARRPPSWVTVEEPLAVPEVLARLEGVVLLDALGTWIANDLEADIDGLVKALVHRPGDTIVVSEEVGLGVHPVSEVGRLFADRLGEANRRVAEVADRCLLVVAGRVIDLPAGEAPTDPTPPTLDPIPAEAQSTAQPVAPDERSRPSTRPERNRLHPTVGEPAPRGGFRQALAFLTPLGGAASPTQAALVWFPVVGATLGLVLGTIWWVTDDALGPFAAAALVVAADLALTGAIHFDGLLDSADGLIPHLPADRRLAVMAEPHVGAFAVAAGVTALLLRTAALTALGAARPFLLATLWCLARTAMAVTALTGRYARESGLASSFLFQPANPASPDSPTSPDLPRTGSGAASPTSPDLSGTGSGAARPTSPDLPGTGSGSAGSTSTDLPGRPEAAFPAGAGGGRPWVPPASVGAVLVLGLAIGDHPMSVIAVAAAAVAAAGVSVLARRRIVGFTGDTLGAGGVVAETVGLLTAVAVLRP